MTALSGTAEFERDLILQRTNEGRARAMKYEVRPQAEADEAPRLREVLKRVAASEPMREIEPS